MSVPERSQQTRAHPTSSVGSILLPMVLFAAIVWDALPLDIPVSVTLTAPATTSCTCRRTWCRRGTSRADRRTIGRSKGRRVRKI